MEILKMVLKGFWFGVTEFIRVLKSAVNLLKVDYKIPRIFGWPIAILMIPINIIIGIVIFIRGGVKGFMSEAAECDEYMRQYDEE